MKDKIKAQAMSGEKPWVKLMGRLKHLHKETERVNQFIEESSENIEPEMGG